MKKDTINYNMRLFYERWKWYFVNAYLIIGVALVVLVFCLVGNVRNDTHPVTSSLETEKHEVDISEPLQQETDQTAKQEESTDKQEKLQTQPEEQEQGQSSYVLLNKTAIADRVSAAMLIMVKDAELVEAEKDVDDETIDYIFDKAEKENVNLFVVGGTYVISEKSYNAFLDNESIVLKRIFGVNMQDTVMEVLNYIKDDVDFSKVYVVNVVDAESCKIAFDMVTENKIPVLPVDYSGVSDDVIGLISKYGITEVEFIGEGIGEATKKEFEDILGSGNVKG